MIYMPSVVTYQVYIWHTWLPVQDTLRHDKLYDIPWCDYLFCVCLYDTVHRDNGGARGVS